MESSVLDLATDFSRIPTRTSGWPTRHDLPFSGQSRGRQATLALSGGVEPEGDARITWLVDCHSHRRRSVTVTPIALAL
jgi:hypothetical protein